VRLGPYEILAPLGAGGMGEVYRARDTRLGREVAIKVLPASFSKDGDRLRRFEQEARAASALNHPNILTIHDFGSEAGAPYVVTELLEGETLRERLARGAIPSRKAVELGVQIANGLAAAHEKGIVHRDLKPENLFVTADGRVKILDFGLAKLTRPDLASGATSAPTQEGTEPGVVMGTVGYMSPEQVRGQAADPRSDIFSFGAILYEMLTGRRAFRGSTAVETMNAILKEDPEDLSETARGVPLSLERVIRRCLEKSPAERFQSARDLGFTLVEASGSAAVAAARPYAGRSRPLLIAASAAVVVVAALLSLNVGGLREKLRLGSPPAAIRSLAVLPLQNLSRDPDQEYFADGMTEELITNLAQIRSLRVISRTSVMAYKTATKPLPQIGKELDVDALVEGSVAKSGNRVRVTAQLVHAATDRHLWAKSYERDLKDALSLQGEIARAVAEEIRTALTPEETARLVRARPVDPELHEIVLRGRFHLNKGTEKDVEKAIQLFEGAIGKDPSLALAWAGMADSYVWLSDIYRAPAEVLPKAKAAAEKALALDDGLAEAHSSLGLVHLLWDWDWSGSEREFRRAIELKPSFADAHHGYGLLLTGIRRREESIAQARLAQRLDPFAPMIAFDSGWANFMARRFDQAIVEFRKGIDFEPNFGWAWGGVAISEVQRGRFAEATAAGTQGTRVDDSPLLLAIVGGVYAAAGEKEKAHRVIGDLAEISKHRYVCPYEIAVIHVNLGQIDQAFEALEKGFRDRSSCMPYLAVDPRFDSLHSDPRYMDLVRRIGLPS